MPPIEHRLVLPALATEIEVAASYGSRGAENPDRQQLPKPATDLLPGRHGGQVRLGEFVLAIGPQPGFRSFPVLQPAIRVGDLFPVHDLGEVS